MRCPDCGSKEIDDAGIGRNIDGDMDIYKKCKKCGLKTILRRFLRG